MPDDKHDQSSRRSTPLELLELVANDDGDVPPDSSVPRRKRGRPTVETKAPRRARGKVRRVVPCYVDMGTLTRGHAVRYDAGQQLYDLTDVMHAAYNGSLATVYKKMSKLKKEGFFSGVVGEAWAELELGLEDMTKIQWTDDCAAGRRRHACSHRATEALLRHTAGPRAPEILGAIACWIKQNSSENLHFLQTAGVQTPAPQIPTSTLLVPIGTG